MNENLFKRISEMAKNIEFFLVESPCNHYQPQPPEGFRYLRSNKHRVLVPIDSFGEGINEVLHNQIALGNYETL
jgi:hypothetical protein